MAPQDKQRTEETTLKKEEHLQLNTLKKNIPADCFVKSLPKACAYGAADLFMWGAVTYAMWSFKNSEMWTDLLYWQQAAVSLAFWCTSGFLMWCIFIIGHDCGHGTFSDYEWINDIAGHITHGSILVPFWPWQLSHRRHHMYHNHIDKDYSHPWYTPERLSRDDEGLARMMEDYPLMRFFFPFIGWMVYLYGMPDGSHIIPFPSQRLWKDTPIIEYYKCIFSSLVVAGFLTAGYFVFGKSLSALAYFYLAPWVVMGWWLVTVTYLQHHDEKTLVYGDADWKFVTAAFETVDRHFGSVFDIMHHHITDGHVVHHLFFTKIPHYNLPRATAALKDYLASVNLSHMYKSDNTLDFVYRVHKYFVQFGFRATRASDVLGKEKKSE